MGNHGLSKEQKAVLDTLKNIPEFRTAQFYLAGGSGLNLYFSHRESIDEDFFTKEPFRPDLLFLTLSKYFTAKKISEEPGTLHVNLNGVLCSFFHYPYPVFELIEFEDVPVASVIDIGCMKLSALISRGSKKDFVDLYHILNNSNTFDELWQAFKEKYGIGDNEIYTVLKSMVYFQDAEKEKLSPELENEWETIKSFFTELAQKITCRYTRS